MRRTIVAVGGFSSDSGKTTLVCELLRRLRGWEAIKVTRGHYRSCGKDPHACCVSHLLSDEPLVRSGRAATYAPGKDTGRYWDAGAANVHWVVVTDKQVGRGIEQALARVEAPAVLVEGNSFLNFVEADFVILSARYGATQIKPTARRVLPKATALYLFEGGAAGAEAWASLARQPGLAETLRAIPTYTRADLPALLERIREVHAGVTAQA